MGTDLVPIIFKMKKSSSLWFRKYNPLFYYSPN